MHLPKLRIVKGYWVCNPIINERRTTWSFGSIEEVSKEQAILRLSEKLSLRREPSSSSLLTVERLVVSYLRHAEEEYKRPDGTPTGEADNLMYGLQPLINLFGAMAAEQLRPRHIEAFVDAQKAGDLSRQTINKRIGMIKRLLKWGKNKEMLTPRPFDACRDYEGIKAGRGVRDSKAIRAVPEPQVDQTIPFLPPTLQAMVQLQLAAAMRPEEVCAIRLVDIDMTREVWVYTPEWHKNKHRGMERRIYLGPKAQEVLKPYLTGKAVDVPIFSPREAVKERRGKMPRARVGECYDTRSYRKAIWYACDKAFPMPEGTDRAQWLRDHRWAPNRLRKLGLDTVKKSMGKQAAKAYAGHSRVETTQDHYLTQDEDLAIKVAQKVG